MAKDTKQILREQRSLYDQMLHAAMQLRQQQQEWNFSSCTYLSKNVFRDIPYAMSHYQTQLDKATTAYSTFVNTHNLPWTPEK